MEETVIERLRESNKRYDERQYQDGLKAGQRWAMHKADAGELRRLERLQGRLENDWDTWFQSDDTRAQSTAGRFVSEVAPELSAYPGGAREFWETAAADEHPEDEFVRGFAEGALEVWDEAQAKF